MIRRGCERSCNQSFDHAVGDRLIKPGILQAAPNQSVLHGQRPVAVKRTWFFSSRPSKKHVRCPTFLVAFSAADPSSGVILNRRIDDVMSLHTSAAEMVVFDFLKYKSSRPTTAWTPMAIVSRLMKRFLITSSKKALSRLDALSAAASVVISWIARPSVKQ